MPEKDINRQVHFIHVGAFDSEDSSGSNNTWVYDRAPEGYLFELQEITISSGAESIVNGICQLYDGHAYTHWNIFPGVEDREILFRAETCVYNVNAGTFLHGWKCKEYTIGIRSTHATQGYKIVAVVWYRLKKASREELLEYAIKHPVREDTFKRALRGSTVELGEA